ncbi:MAG: hypothetical protein KKH60_11205, partial [Proteobacteria bacterium]|nr:hypothetical protein [Pseudomonadota bacterium]
MKLCIHVFVWVLLGMNLVLVEQSYAQQEQLSHSPQEIVTIAIDIEQVKQSITATKDRLEIAESMESAETASQLGVPLTRLQEYNANLRKIEAVYQRQLTSIERRDSLTREKEKLGKQLESQQESLIAQPSPYNLSFYDSLLDELTTVQQEEQTIIIVLKSEKKVFEEAKTKLEQAGHNVRAATEELQKVDQTDKSLQMSWRLEYAKVAEELAKALLDLQRMTVENAETELGLAQLKKQITQRHVNWVRSKLAFDQEDLYNHLDSLEERRITLQIRVDTLRQGQQDVESAWLEAQNEFEAAQSAEEAVKARAMAFLKAREAWRDTYQKVLEQTEIIQLILEQEKQFWQRRYGLLEKDVHYEELDSWEKQTSDYVQNIERNIRVKGKYQTNLQSEIAGIQKQLADEAISPDMKE